MNKKQLLIIYLLIAIFSLGMRFWKINILPSVISHDEIFYPVQAKTLAVNGRGLDGQWRPLSLTAEVELYAELPGLIMAPAAKLLPNQPILAAKITHLLLGTALIFVLAGLAYTLTGQHAVAISTALVASVNPWLFQFSRMGFDSLLSLFFYFAGLWVFLQAKNWRKLWAWPLLVLGFFQYQGLKVIFLPMVLLASWFNWQKKQRNLSTLATLSLSILLFAFHLFTLQSQTAANRLNFLVFNDQNYISQEINLGRQQSLNGPLANIYPNRITVVAERLIEQYINALDLKQWFFELEIVRNPFAVYQHGLFYAIDFVFILIGLILIWQKRSLRKAATLISGLLLIAPLPAAIVSTGSWLVFRVSFLIPASMILIGYALAKIAKTWPKAIFIGIVLCYALFIGRFFYEYFYHYPVLGTRDQYFAERIIAQYIKRNPDRNIIVVAAEPIFVFEEILIHNNLINRQNIAAINLAFQTKDFQLDNFKVVGERCVPGDLEQDSLYISHSNVRPCVDRVDSPLDYTQIPSLLDGGGIYRVYQDSYCGNFSLARFPHIKEDLFDLDRLNQQDFCQNFIIRN